MPTPYPAARAAIESVAALMHVPGAESALNRTALAGLVTLLATHRTLGRFARCHRWSSRQSVVTRWAVAARSHLPATAHHGRRPIPDRPAGDLGGHSPGCRRECAHDRTGGSLPGDSDDAAGGSVDPGRGPCRRAGRPGGGVGCITAERGVGGRTDRRMESVGGAGGQAFRPRCGGQFGSGIPGRGGRILATASHNPALDRLREFAPGVRHRSGIEPMAGSSVAGQGAANRARLDERIAGSHGDVMHPPGHLP